MRYDAELRFFFRVLKNLNLPVRILSASRERMEGEELDIYSILYSELSYEDIFNHIIASCKPKRIYRVTDEFFCSYLIFRLPEIPEDSYILIGPYTKFHIEKEEILTNAERLSLPPGLYPQVEKFYMNLTRISDPNALAALINTLAMVLWESPEEFAWEDLDISQVDFFPIRVKDSFVSEFEDPYQEQMKLEKYYRGENEFLEIVSRGQMDKAEDLMKNYTLDRLEQRLSDSVRDVKNYSIIFNTLLRKAAEKGGVHPIHIHKISSGYAKEIELLTSAEAAMKLHKRMVHKYCLLVKNHSLKSYSPLVKKVITNVDADLTADLTLKAQAGLLNINASYLSALFKKEVGITLTEYVNKSRVSHAVNLLNTTNMQVQLIAQYCGIPDVNYFTKLFKKYIGKTPQEYRRNISSSTRKA